MFIFLSFLFILFTGRMALLVTLFLVLVNIFNSVTANAPKSEGLTAVEFWVVMCILHVFCVLSEYAIILKIIQMEKRKMTAKLRKLDKANTALSASNTSLNNKSFLSNGMYFYVCTIDIQFKIFFYKFEFPAKIFQKLHLNPL